MSAVEAAVGTIEPDTDLLAEPTFEECHAEACRFMEEKKTFDLGNDYPEQFVAYYGGRIVGHDPDDPNALRARAAAEIGIHPAQDHYLLCPNCFQCWGVKMPALELFVQPREVRNLPIDGNIVLDPPLPNLKRVLIRHLSCMMRVAPIPGVEFAYLDTGSPLSIIPYRVWHDKYGWQAKRDFDELNFAEAHGLKGQVLQYHYSFRLAQLRVPVELAGKDLKAARLRIDSLVCQLANPGGPPFVILGLWGGILEGRRLAIDRLPGSDEIRAALEW